jgi:hypothetical protein
VITRRRSTTTCSGDLRTGPRDAMRLNGMNRWSVCASLENLSPTMMTSGFELGPSATAATYYYTFHRSRVSVGPETRWFTFRRKRPAAFLASSRHVVAKARLYGQRAWQARCRRIYGTCGAMASRRGRAGPHVRRRRAGQRRSRLCLPLRHQHAGHLKCSRPNCRRRFLMHRGRPPHISSKRYGGVAGRLQGRARALHAGECP